MNRYNSKWTEIEEEEWLADGAAYAPDYCTYLLSYDGVVYILFDNSMESVNKRKAFGEAVSRY